MSRIFSVELARHVGERVRLAGWLHHQRALAHVSFVLLRDGKGVAQVVVVDEGAREQLAALLPETVIQVEGTVVGSEQAPAGVELHDPSIDVLVEPDIAPPFELRRREIHAQLPTILDHAAVSLRHPRRRAAFALAATSVGGFRATLDAASFVEVHTPKVVAAATESGANVFPVDWFGRPAFLAQSPQFYKQIMVGVFERVYEVAPVFRAEPHDTVRHLAEYVSLDAELGFITDHHDVMRVLRDALAGMVEAMRERAAGVVVDLELVLPVVPAHIPVVDFTEAQTMIERATGESIIGEPDLAPAHERWLGEWAAREQGSDFLYVSGYPMAKRPFYTQPDPHRPAFSNSFDLLFRGLELATGGQRMHRLADYLAALAGQDLAPYEGYLEAFRHGMPPHGGFAIGLERFTARVTGAVNVRETTLFPRDRNRLTP
ncbi:MAG: aspartate--tRNA(Asn) ligase [Acidimicrobiia bacterium]